MIHNVFALNELKEPVSLVCTPKCFKYQEAKDDLHDDMNTAVDLGFLFFTVFTCIVMHCEDKDREIWNDEKHDLMAHEYAEDIDADVFLS